MFGSSLHSWHLNYSWTSETTMTLHASVSIVLLSRLSPVCLLWPLMITGRTGTTRGFRCLIVAVFQQWTIPLSRNKRIVARLGSDYGRRWGVSSSAHASIVRIFEVAGFVDCKCLVLPIGCFYVNIFTATLFKGRIVTIYFLDRGIRTYLYVPFYPQDVFEIQKERNSVCK